jgi:hypothetical protein
MAVATTPTAQAGTVAQTKAESLWGSSARSVDSALERLGAPTFLQWMFVVYMAAGIGELFGLMVQGSLALLDDPSKGVSTSGLALGLLLPVAIHFARFALVFHTENRKCRVGVISLDLLLTVFHASRISTLEGDSVLLLVARSSAIGFMLMDFLLCLISFVGLLGMARRERLPEQSISPVSREEDIGVRIMKSYEYVPQDPRDLEQGFQDGCEKSCLICMEAFEAGEKLSELHCRHRFHAACISTWISSNKSCPMRCAHANDGEAKDTDEDVATTDACPSVAATEACTSVNAASEETGPETV